MGVFSGPGTWLLNCDLAYSSHWERIVLLLTGGETEALGGSGITCPRTPS